MRIAQIAPLIERVPPKKYGGTERMIHALTEELVARGHDVTLFATADSLTSARLIGTYPNALRIDMPAASMQRVIWGLRHAGIAYNMQDEFDIIHDHTSWLGAAYAQASRTPVVMTMHGIFTEENKNLFGKLRNPYLVTISRAQRMDAPHLNHIATVYNGLPLENYPFSYAHDGYLLYVGRFCKEKSPHYAIEIAKKLGMPLIMAAKKEGKEAQAYFDEFIKPHLSDKIRWIGEVNEKTRNALYSKAYCFLHPISWPEPFGLTLIEAMATGCPVVAFANGAIPEVIAHGKTGFVVDSLDEMVDAVSCVANISRSDCRSYALQYFSAKRMAESYEHIYKQIIQRHDYYINNKVFTLRLSD